MEQINKIRISGKTIQSQRPTFSISATMKSTELFSLIQKDVSGNTIGNINFNISLKSLKSYNDSPPICDEILIDLVAQKTYHIRRVGVSIIHSLSGGYTANGELFSGYTIPKDLESNSTFEPNSYTYSYCDKMCTQEKEIESFNANREFCGNLNGDITDKWFFRIKASTVGKNTNQGFLEWSQKTPITIYAKLQEPIITEIEHIAIDPLATNFEIYLSESTNIIMPTLVIEYEKDYKIAINEVEAEIDNVESEITKLQNLKSDKPSTTTIKVDTPTWTNQPTVSGNLDSSFKIWSEDFYYVTLKDTSGNALSANQFKLTTTYNGYATAINQIFNLTNLATGNSGSLSENSIIDFKEISTNFKLRIAGVSNYSLLMTNTQKLKFNIQASLIIPFASIYLTFGVANNSFNCLCAVGKYSNVVTHSSTYSNTKKFHSYAISGELSFNLPNKIGNLKCNISGGSADSYDFNTGYTGITKNTQPETTLFFTNDISTPLDIRIGANSGAVFFRNGTLFNIEYIG